MEFKILQMMQVPSRDPTPTHAPTQCSAIGLWFVVLTLQVTNFKSSINVLHQYLADRQLKLDWAFKVFNITPLQPYIVLSLSEATVEVLRNILSMTLTTLTPDQLIHFT